VTRPSVEQWEVRQMMLDKLESDPQQLRFSSGVSSDAASLGVMGQQLQDISGEITMHSSEWDREGAIEGLKKASQDYNEVDLTSDPQAPLKALINDTARFIASAAVLTGDQSARFFENFAENSRGVFVDPRSSASLKGNNFPKSMIVEATQRLTLGMGDVGRRMIMDKAGEGIRQASSLNAKANQPKSAYELSNNRSFDQEMANKKDPFSHLRGRDIQIERNQDSNLPLSQSMEPK